MRDFEEILRLHARRYPLMQPCDAVKLLYQHVFGGGHLVTDEAACLHALRTEYAAPGERGGELLEEIGNGYFRLNLFAVGDKELPLPLICKIFMLSSERPAGDRSTFLTQFDLLRFSARQGIFSFSAEEMEEYLVAYKCAGYPLVSHSDAYRNAYHPAYRVIDGPFASLLPLLRRLSPLLAKKKAVSAALDGRAAAGKTTTAALLGLLYGANVLHMDDFFLPPELRTPERYAQPGGNIHYERFRQEVLPALRRGGPFAHRVFNCSIGDYGGMRRLERNPLTIVEGVYSHHPFFGKAYDLRVFLNSSDEVQRQRILERNGLDGLRVFEERWIPLENEYFTAYSIPEQSSLTLCL